MYVETLTQTSVLIMSSRIFTDREENSLSRKLRENLLEVFAGKAYNMNRKLRILGSGSLRERIVRFLVECQDSEGTDPYEPVQRRDGGSFKHHQAVSFQRAGKDAGRRNPGT